MNTLRLQLAGGAADVPLARRAVTEALAGEPSEVVETAQLLVSEIVTNVVLHARTPCVVEIEHRGTTARIGVTDESTALPQPRVHGAEASTGRGLRLLGTLATDWGISRPSEHPGKTVWFEVDLEHAPAADEALASIFAGDWLAEFERIDDDLRVGGSDR